MDVDSIVTLVGRRYRNTNSSATAHIIDGINWTRRWLQTQFNWSWLQTAVKGIRTIDPETYSSVTVTSASASVVLATTDAYLTQVNTDIGNSIYPFVKFGSETRFYRVTAYSYSAPNTTLTITPTYIGTTSSSQTMTLYFMEYALPSDVAHVRMAISDDGVPMTAIELDEHWYLNPNPTRFTGKPTSYVMKRGTLAKMLCDPIPDDVYSLQLEYAPVMSNVASAGTEASIVVPAIWHDVLVEGALWYLRLNYTDDDRFQVHENYCREKLDEMRHWEITNGRTQLPVIGIASGPRGLANQRRVNLRGGRY